MLQKFYIFLFMFLNCSLLFSEEGKWELIDTLRIPYKTGYIAYTNKGIDCADEKNCCSVGLRGWVSPWNRFTSDGGKTWRSTLKDTAVFDNDGYLIYYPAKANEIAYPDTSLCIIVCDTGYYWKSKDKCETWERFKFDTDYKLKHIDFYNKNIGCIQSYKSSYFTRNSGEDWEEISILDVDSSYTNVSFLEVSIPEPDVIIMLLYDNDAGRTFTIRSKDWGKNWEINSYIYPRIGKLFFLNEDLGYAAGKQQTEPDSPKYRDIIQKTTDGGATWVVQLDSLVKNYYGLHQIYFTDELNGVALGEWHVLYRTSDGGENWIRDTSYNRDNIDNYFYDLALLGSTNKFLGLSYIVGDTYLYTGPDNGIEEQIIEKNEHLYIYPNPAQPGESINIKYTSSSAMEIEFRVYDSMGRLMDEPRTIFSDFGEHSLRYSPGRNFPPGVYWVKALCGGVVLSRAFVVE